MTSEVSSELAVPTSRRLIGRAFDLDIRSSRDLRRASLFMAAQFLLVVGPVIFVVAVLLLRIPAFAETFDPTAFEPGALENMWDSEFVFFSQLTLASLIAVVGFIAITIESQIVAITVLAGRLVGRPVTLRQAVARSRQAFWRMVRASILVGIPAGLAAAFLEATVGRFIDPQSEGYALLSLGVGVLVAIPFAYVPAGIVLGDVGAREAIVRGYRLVRANQSIAVVIALFTAAAQFLQLFAIGAGGDVVVRVGVALGLGFDHGGVQSVVTYAVILASILAVGTLLFTTIAIAIAPQVVAFMALTRVQTGLDRVLGPLPTALAATDPQAIADPLAEAMPGPPSEPVAEAKPGTPSEPVSGAMPGTPSEPVAGTATQGATPATPDPFVARRTFWDELPFQPETHRLVSIPMVVGGVLAIVIALAALDGIQRLA